MRSKDIAQLIKNPELFRTTNELFSALKKEHPEASDLEILEDIEKRLKLSNGEGLLKALSDSGQEIRFDWLSQEEFSLQELDELQLEKVLFLPKSVRMKKGLENALVSHIKQSFLAKVSEPLSQLLEHELFPNTRSLSELLLAIQQFPQILQAIQEEEKKTLF